MLVILRQFVHFSGVGSISAIGHYGLLVLLVKGLDVAPVSASAAGALLGAWINYSLNYRFVFLSTKSHRDAAVKFAGVASIGLVLNTMFMRIGVEWLELYYLLSQIVTTGLVLIWSFFGNRYWTFNTSPKKK